VSPSAAGCFLDVFKNLSIHHLEYNESKREDVCMHPAFSGDVGAFWRICY
jgi:hypothetical protein